MGRHTEFTQEAADAICERIAGGESLRSVCRSEEMPVTATVCKWLTQQPSFAEQYTRAREAALQAYEEDILDLSEDALTYIDKEGNNRVDPGDVQRRRLRADNLKWLMSKLAPKKYGDKLELGGSIRIHEAAIDELA